MTLCTSQVSIGWLKFDAPLNILTMTQMFNEAISFDQPSSTWDVHNVLRFTGMFAGAEEIQSAFESLGCK
jgi:hypothetical protein